MSDRLVLWRWPEALEVRGVSDVSSVGSQMRHVEPGDRLFICATRGQEVFLLGAIRIKKIEKVRSVATREALGSHRATGKNISGPFGISPLGNLKWKLRFESAEAPALLRGVHLGQQ